MSAAWPGPGSGMGPCRVTCFQPEGIECTWALLQAPGKPASRLFPTSLWAPQPPAEGAASPGNWLLMQGPLGASQARQTAGWRRPAPSSPATKACGSSVEQGSRRGREPRVGGRLLLGHLPWAGALCQGALAEPLQGAWGRMVVHPPPPGPRLLGQQEVERSSCGPQTLESWLGPALRGHRTGLREALQPLGPRQPRGLGGRKGKGDVIAAWNLLFGGVAMETGRLRVGKNSKPKRV